MRLFSKSTGAKKKEIQSAKSIIREGNAEKRIFSETYQLHDCREVPLAFELGKMKLDAWFRILSKQVGSKREKICARCLWGG